MTSESGAEGSNDVSVIVPIQVAGRIFRIHLAGDSAGMAAIRKELPLLAQDANDEDYFLSSLTPRLAAHRIALVDTMDLAAPYARDSTLLLLHAAAHLKTADQTWIHIRYLLSQATEADLEELIRPQNLPFVRGLVNDVLDDLDERSESEREALRLELPEPIAYLLLN